MRARLRMGMAFAALLLLGVSAPQSRAQESRAQDGLELFDAHMHYKQKCMCAL